MTSVMARFSQDEGGISYIAIKSVENTRGILPE